MIKPLILNSSGIIQEVTSGDYPIGIPPRHVCAMKLENGADAGKVTISSGMTVSDDMTMIMVLSELKVLDLATSGLWGLDTGSEQADTFYYVWVIGNVSTGAVGALLSSSPTDPTLPAGYTKKRRVGTIYNSPVGDIFNFMEFGSSGQERTFLYKESRLDRRVLELGATTVWTTVSLAELVPPTALLCVLDFEAVSKDAEVRLPGMTPALYFLYRDTSVQLKLPNVSQQLEYQMRNSGGNLSISVCSFYEEI